MWIDKVFCLGMGLALFLLLGWGFKVLPDEEWQFIATVPSRRLKSRYWQGLNLTYYGFFTALGYTLAVAAWFILLYSVYLKPSMVLITAVSVIIPGTLSSKIVARLVEKKPNTFSVGAAAFSVTLIGPWLISAIQSFLVEPGFQVITVMSALSVAYALGEGVGRLACISFGCCYGKPVNQLPPLLQKVFGRFYFIFSGETKKVAYADKLSGKKIVPIQAITSVIFCLASVVGFYLFLQGYYRLVFIGVVAITQLWRFVSEFMRADYRGGGKISAYQWMGLATVFYSAGIIWWFPAPYSPGHDLILGLKTLWYPGGIIFLQTLWIAIFLYTGRSKVTAATIGFNVVEESI